MESMCNGNQMHYYSNYCCNHNSSQWRHVPSCNNFNICCEQKKMICEPGTTKGLIHSLKDKLIGMQSDGLRFKFRKKPVKRKQNEYYCLMLRKINTLEKKLQNLEDLYFSQTNHPEEELCDSEHLCDYLTFYSSVRSLVDLANQLKEEIYTKNDTQYKNQNYYQLYNRIHVLESDLQDLFLYLEQLQNCRNISDQENSCCQKYNYKENIAASSPRIRVVDKTQPNIGKGIHQSKQKSKSKFNRTKKFKKDSPNFDQTTQTTTNSNLTNKSLAELENNPPSKVTVTINPENIKNKKKITKQEKDKTKRSKGDKQSSKMSSISPSRQFQTQVVNYYKENTNENRDNCQDKLNNCKHKRYNTFLEDKTERSYRQAFNSKPTCQYIDQSLSNISVCSCNSCIAERRWRSLSKYKNNSVRQSQKNSVCSCSMCNDNSDKEHIPTIYKKPYNNQKVLFLKPTNDKLTFNRAVTNGNQLQHKNRKIYPQYFDVSCDKEEDVCFCRPEMTTITHRKNNVNNTRQYPTRWNNQFYQNLMYMPYQQRFKNKTKSKQKKQTKKFDRPQMSHHQAENDKEHIRSVYYYDISPDKDSDIVKNPDRKQHQYEEQDNSDNINKKQANKHFNISHREQYKRDFRGSPNQSNNSKKHFVSNKKNYKHVRNNGYLYHGIDSYSSNSESEDSNYSTLIPDNMPFKKKLSPGTHLHIKFYENEEVEELQKLPYNGEKFAKFKHRGPFHPSQFYERKEPNKWPYDNDWQRPVSWGSNKFFRRHQENIKFNKPFGHNGRSSDSVNQNGYSSDDSACHCRVSMCNNPKCTADNIPDDMVVFLENNDTSSLSEASDLKKVINSLKDVENDVCEKCIVKEKKIKLVPNNEKKFNGKGKTKVILKKEIIKCPNCRSKLNKRIFKATHKWSNSDIQDSKSMQPSIKEVPSKILEGDKRSTKAYSKGIQMENTNTPRMSFTISPDQKVETGDSKIEDVSIAMQNKKPLPVFQAQVDQGNIFKQTNSQNIVDSQKSLDIPNYGNTININIERGSYSVRTFNDKKIKHKSRENMLHEDHSRENSEKSIMHLLSPSNEITKLNKRSENGERELNSEKVKFINSYDKNRKKQEQLISKTDVRDENPSHCDKSTAMSKSSKTTIFQSLIMKTTKEDLTTATKNDIHKEQNNIMSYNSKLENGLPSKEEYLEENKNTKETANLSTEISTDKKVMGPNRNQGFKDYLYSNRMPYKPFSQKMPLIYSVLSRKGKNNASVTKVTKSKEIFNYFPKKSINAINQGRRTSKQFKHKQTGYPKLSSKDILRNSTRKQFRNCHTNSSYNNLQETSSDTKLDSNNDIAVIPSESSYSVLNWEKVASKLKEEQILS
uniref:Uncharacterized protein n=1 Tax=Cuerna arida TaxID=1464854 RepID=A0A1B6ETA3_9HEMI